MIKYTKLFLFIAIIAISHTLRAQTINFSGPTGEIASGTIVTFEVIGETANKYVGSVPNTGSSSHTDIRCNLWDVDYYADNHQKGKFKYKVENNITTGRTVTMTFTVMIINKASNGSISYESKNIEYSLTVGPKVIPPIVTPPILNNTISITSGDLNLFDSYVITGSNPTGGDGNNIYSWVTVGEDGNIISTSSMAVVTNNSWERNNTNSPPFYSNEKVYLFRKITSGTSVSASNKILISKPINNYDLMIKINGSVAKFVSSNPTVYNKVNDDVYINQLHNAGFPLPIINSLVLVRNTQPETIFTIETPSVGVRYKWYFQTGLGILGAQEGSMIQSQIPTAMNFVPSFLILVGDDGFYKRYPIPTINNL